jgi:hypothetical protein
MRVSGVQNGKRRPSTAPALGFVALLSMAMVASVLPLLPHAHADHLDTVTWTTLVNTTTGMGSSPNVDAIDSIQFDDSNVVHAYTKTSSANLVVRRCNAGTCQAEVSLGTGSDIIQSISLSRKVGAGPGGQLALCYSNGTQSGVFYSTSNDGISWSPGVHAAGILNFNAGDCKILPNGTIVAVVGGNSGSGFSWSWSSNGGLSWAGTRAVSAGVPFQSGAMIMAKDNWNWTIVGNAASSTYICTTSNMWANGVTCGSYSTTLNTKDLNQFSTTHADIPRQSNEASNVFRTSDGGTTWSLSTAPGVPSNLERVAAARLSTTEVAYASSSTSGTAPCRVWLSNDNASTWTSVRYAVNSTAFATSTVDLAFTGDGETIQVICIFKASADAATRVVIRSGRLNSAPPPFASVEIHGLTGFDVDRTGTLIIAREENGSHIRTYSATDLSPSPHGQVQTSCDDGSDVSTTQDRILAHSGEFGDYVAYIVCDVADSTDPTEIHIRNGLGSPASFTGCSTCPSDISLAGFSEAGGDHLFQLNEIIEFPMDFTRTRNLLVGKQRVFAWAWSSTEGSIGVDIFTTGPGNGHQVSVQNGYSSNGGAEQICAWENPADGRQYIAAVDTATTSRIWEFVPAYDEVDQRQEGSLQLRHVLNINVANAKGVGCGRDRVLILRDNDLTAIQASTGAQQWRIEWTGSSPPPRAATLSDDSHWFGYYDGATLRVGNATTGTVTCPLEGMGDGTIIGMEMDAHGQQLYLAQAGSPGNITAWALQQNGCSTEHPVGSVTIVTGGDDEDIPTFFGSPIPVPKGFTAWGWKLTMAVLLCLGMATAIGFAFGGGRSFNRVGGIIGTVGGFFTSWGANLLDAVAVFVILAVSAIAYFVARRRGG